MRRALGVPLAAVLMLLTAGAASAQTANRTVVAGAPHIRPIAPAAAPDGSVWFGEDGVSRLGRIAPDGTLTEFPVPRGLDAFSEDLRVEAIGPDGRVWFLRDFEDRVGVLDPASGAVQFPQLGVSSGALTITADGAVWLAGDLTGGVDRAGVVRIAPDGTRRLVELGVDRTFYAIAPSLLSPGAVLVVREDGEGRSLVHVDAGGAARPIRIPPGTNGLATVGSGPAGTYAGLEGRLLRLDGDFVARRVAGVATELYNFRRGLGFGGDGSIWIPGDPVVRLKPGTLPARIATGLTSSTEGIAVAASNDAWMAIEQPSSAQGTERERLVRVTPAGQVFEHVIGTPPRATATVLSGRDADSEAAKLAFGDRMRLRARVRCSGACSVRVAVATEGDERGYARRTVRLAAAGTRVVTLRRTRRPPLGATRKSIALLLAHDARSPYLLRSPAQRPGAGRVIAVAPPEGSGDG